jgi:hypothetical protein
VAAEAALAERSEQVAQRPVAEKIERLVGDFELRVLSGCPPPASARAPLASRSGGSRM